LREAVDYVGGELKRKPGLPGSAGAGEREQSHRRLGERIEELPQLALAAEKGPRLIVSMSSTRRTVASDSSTCPPCAAAMIRGAFARPCQRTWVAPTAARPCGGLSGPGSRPLRPVRYCQCFLDLGGCRDSSLGAGEGDEERVSLCGSGELRDYPRIVASLQEGQDRIARTPGLLTRLNAYPLRPVAGLAAASVLAVAALQADIHETGSSFYSFLTWNLILAWVPLVAALACNAFARSASSRLATGAGVIWLLFFPNAPYMLTDYIHIRESPVAGPLWWDVLMLSSFVWTSLMLGFLSLYLMQEVWRAYWGSLVSWLLVTLALGLGSFGVYLGRFVRLNSWDALLHPASVAHIIATQLENPVQQPRLLGVVVLLTGFMLIGYVVLCSFGAIQQRVEERV
jgi:uncharacterized membrane protein